MCFVDSSVLREHAQGGRRNGDADVVRVRSGSTDRQTADALLKCRQRIAILDSRGWEESVGKRPSQRALSLLSDSEQVGRASHAAASGKNSWMILYPLLP